MEYAIVTLKFMWKVLNYNLELKIVCNHVALKYVKYNFWISINDIAKVKKIF